MNVCDDLLVWAKLSDLYRQISTIPADGVVPGSWFGKPSPALTPAMGRAVSSYWPVIEPPRLDARRILGRWLTSRRPEEPLRRSA